MSDPTTTPESSTDHSAPGQSTSSATPHAQPKKPGAFREILETLLLAVIIFVVVRQVVLNFRVDGHSMDPNLHNGEMVLVTRHLGTALNPASLINWIPGVEWNGHDFYPFGAPERGDIIVFNPPNGDQPYIKRIIGLPGDVITFRDGYVYVNGERLDEPYLEPGITRCPTERCRVPVTVGDDEVYVLGDNRGNSEDSRYFGPFRISNVIGKAWITYWPVRDFGRVPHYDYAGIPAASAPAGD